MGSRRWRQINRNEVQTLKKGLDIFRLLIEEHGLTTQDIIERLDLNQSTAYRMISTLEQNGFIAKGDDNRYAVSESFLAKLPGTGLRTHDEFMWRSVSFMDRLSRETGETTYIGLLQGTEMMIAQAVSGKYATRTHHEIGDRLPLHVDAIGKCLLAFQTEAERERIIGQLAFSRLTEHSITDPGLFRNELERIRQNGYSLDNEEGEIGVRCIGAPIRKGDQVLAAIALSGPSVRLSKDKDPEHIELVKACARSISETL
ncbi:IclR family transcriptional regulator [Paenibacillus macerans]|uniref:IclR family transcriptional regulator n=1 Tax=Paenibacillus macerans TaxID=44252 RepID=UPI003D318295